MSAMAVPRITLVTFGGGSNLYRRSVRRVGSEARDSGMFSTVLALDDRYLSREHSDFCLAHASMLCARTRGFGYWVWKPLIVKQALSTGAEYVIYVDAGCTLNLSSATPRRRLIEYIELADTRGGLMMQLDHPEWKWSKVDTTRRLGLTDAQLASGQLCSSVLLLKNCADVRSVVDEWGVIASESKYHFLDDSPSLEVERTGFVEHRHDQSIMSGLAKIAGFETIPDETYFVGNWAAAGAHVPIWATRIKARFNPNGGPADRALAKSEELARRTASRIRAVARLRQQ